MILRLIAFGLFAPLLAAPCYAAELADRYSTFEAMHGSTYGTLFFAEGVGHDYDLANAPGFVLVRGNGNVDLPQQPGGYCFVFNHYNPSIRSTLSRTYRARTLKTYANGKVTSPAERFSSEFIPTPDLSSKAVPSYCVSNVANVTQIQIDFSSEAGPSFTHSISFQLIPAQP